MVLPSAVGEASDDWLAATRSELAARGAAADVLDRIAPVLPAG